MASLDLENLKLVENKNSKPIFSGYFRQQGLVFNSKKHFLTLNGKRTFDLPFEYLGADDKAGPNYTGQPAVDSYYKMQDLFS